jgi:hypothetical protein
VQDLWISSAHFFVEIFSWQHLSSWQFYFFIYLVFAIGSSLTLSPPDIKAAAVGFIAIVVSIFILDLATVWTSNFVSDFVFRLAAYYVFFYALAFLVLLINLALALLVFLPLFLLKSKDSKAA